MPVFSLAERDRRWARVRVLMESAGMAILVVADRSSTRYLTQIDDPDAATIFLVGDEPTVFVTPRADPASSADGWLKDVRRLDGSWTLPVIDRLSELGADRAIVGITGLDPLLRAADGNLNYGSFVVMREWLSHARWVGASILMREATAVKSAEEIAALRLASAAAEAGLDAALSQPLAATGDRALWARSLAATILTGAEPGGELVLSVNGEPSTRPQGRAFAPGDLIHLRITAAWAGYRASIVQPVAIAEPRGREGEAWQVHLKSWERAWSQLGAGASLADLAAAPRESGGYRVVLDLEGAGLGDDLPWLAGGDIRASSLEGPALREGECFLVCPTVGWDEANQEHHLAWGDTVAISAAGPQRMGSRPRELRIWK